MQRSRHKNESRKMNILSQISVKRNPFTYFYEEQAIVMQGHQLRAMPALISELTDMAIANADPLYCVGRVMVFNVTPYRKIDPPLIVCAHVNLKEYYFLWRHVIFKDFNFSTSRLIAMYDEMIKLLDICRLRENEASFMFIEMLKFKNEYVRH